jgi:hypothetical protein
MIAIYDLIKELKESDDEYLQERGNDIERYINQFEEGRLPESLCRSYIQDVRDLIELDRLRDKVKNLALAQRAIEKLTELLMKGIAAGVKGVL